MFLVVILSITPHGLKMDATAPGRHQHITSIGEKGAVSSLCLFSGAKNLFPEAPSRLLTSHWPELDHMSQKGLGPHVYFNQSGFTYIWVGRGGHGIGHMAVQLKANMPPASSLVTLSYPSPSQRAVMPTSSIVSFSAG